VTHANLDASGRVVGSAASATRHCEGGERVLVLDASQMPVHGGALRQVVDVANTDLVSVSAIETATFLVSLGVRNLELALAKRNDSTDQIRGLLAWPPSCMSY
jgi:hypothetical protein